MSKRLNVCTCGGKPEIEVNYSGMGEKYNLYTAFCPECDKYTDRYDSKAEAIEVWNNLANIGEVVIDEPINKQGEVKMQRYKMLRDNVLVHYEIEEKTESGIYIPHMEEDRTTTRVVEVVEIGNEVRDIKVGMMVVITEHAGEQIGAKDTGLSVIVEGEIAAILLD